MIVRSLGKRIPVHIQGDGLIPLLVVGPGDLFRKGNIPNDFKVVFTVYFVDFFRKSTSDSSDETIDIKNLMLDDYIKCIEDIRKELKIEKMMLFGHSVNGILAIVYSYRYAQHVLGNIIVGTSPIPSMECERIKNEFFSRDASEKKKAQFEDDQRKMPENASFPETHTSNRVLTFHDPTFTERKDIWEGTDYDWDLVGRLYSHGVVGNFDLRKKKEIEILVPTFLALGRYDYLCPYTIWTKVIKDLGGIEKLEHHLFRESAHWSMIEEEKEFMGKLISFLHKNKIL